MRKNVEGAEFFLPVSMIVRAAGYAAEQFRADNNLFGLERDRFIERLVFWGRMARDAGWQLDWRGMHGSRNDVACRTAAQRGDFEPLRDMFSAIVTEAIAPAARNAAWRAAEQARLAFPTTAAPVEDPHR